MSGITNHTVKVSSSRLRLIADPCARLLTQLHKLEWLSQLPPSAAAGVKRRQVERFRRHLFGLGTSAGAGASLYSLSRITVNCCVL